MTLPKDLSHGPDIDHRFRTSEAFHLGEALITPSLNRIDIHGTAHQVEPKVMKVLLLLCARPGHVVYRDQILQPVWGHTGDDYLLNRAISELRKIFTDSAQKPAYIETIRKTGYRLVAPIKPVASAALVADKPPAQKVSKPADQIPEVEAATAPATAAHSDHSHRRRRLAGTVAVLGICALVLWAGRAYWFASERSYSIDHYQVYPATHSPGREYDAALSPDGSRIAYIADDTEKPAAVFIKMVRGEQALQLSPADGHVANPRWMPDGQGVVYLHLQEPTLQFVRVSPMGGAGQVIHQDTGAYGVRGMSIAGDGRQIVYAKRSSPGGAHQLWLLSLVNGETSQLTTPLAGSLGDIDPLFAPDGRSIVFVRSSDEVTKDIYTLDIDRNSLTRLTHDNRKINGVAWSPDGRQLLFTSTRSGIYRLWTIDREGGEPQPLSLGWESAQRPGTSLGVDALIFEDWKHTAKLMSMDLTRKTPPQPLKMSLRWDSNPSLSPDGKDMVFASNRGGPIGIWRSALNSDVAHEWANLDGAFIDNPTWSPDGRRIVFDASPEGRAQLYLLDSGSTVPRPLPLGNFDNRTPAWSRDGEWIYFESNRDGSWQLYGWHVGSEKLNRINVVDGRNPQESIDGEWLLYAAGENIVRCRKTQCLSDVAGNSDASEELISGIQEEDIYNWTPARQGIYFVQRMPDSTALPEIAFYGYADRKIETIATLNRDFRGWGMTLSPDETQLYFTEMTLQGADIKIARP